MNSASRSRQRPIELLLSPVDNRRLANLCGSLDENLRQIETALDVTIARRGERFAVRGPGALRAADVLQNFYMNAAEPLSVEQIQLDLIEQLNLPLRGVSSDSVDQPQLLTRPAVEAGERLGFLPGDLAQKVDPYLRPLYDALYDLMGFDRVTKAFEKGTLEIAPLAYMRGRTLNHAFIILDEAQNTTPEQMKMFLTRIGIGAKAVITGDVTQVDLPKGQKSGLIEARRILHDVRGIAFTEFGAEDVVRHPLVARIVAAYEAHQKMQEAGK